MPSASMRAVTSADEPAGKSTVISSGPRCGNAGSCAAARTRNAKTANRAFMQHLLDLDTSPSPADLMPASITASERVLRSPSISGSPSPRTARANSSSSSTIGSFFPTETASDCGRAALQAAQPLVQVVIGARFLAVDVHQVVLGGRRVARVERRQRAVFVLEHQARDIGVVARQHQPHEAPAHRLHRPDQVLEHVGVVDADLQHHAAGHALGGVAPRGEVDLAQPVAADVGLGVDELAEVSAIFLDPAKMALAPALIAQREHHLRLAAGLGERSRVGDRVGDRLVEEHVLAGPGRGARGLAVHAVRRGVDDRLDALVFEDLLVRPRRLAAVLGRELCRAFPRAAEAGGDLQLAGALDGVGEHI